MKINGFDFPNPSQNEAKILLKSIKKQNKFDEKRQHYLRGVKKPKKLEKFRKKCGKLAQNPPKRRGTKTTAGLREALPGSYLELKKAITIY